MPLLSSPTAGCVDIDECALEDEGGRCEASCVNVPGAYACECDEGFVPIGYECKGLPKVNFLLAQAGVCPAALAESGACHEWLQAYLSLRQGVLSFHWNSQSQSAPCVADLDSWVHVAVTVDKQREGTLWCDGKAVGFFRMRDAIPKTTGSMYVSTEQVK